MKLIPLVRSQTQKTIKFLIYEQKLIKFKLSFSSLTSVFHSFTAIIFFQKFYNFHHSHNTKFTKNCKFLPTTRNKIFEKFYKFATRASKKGHAGIVTGESPPPPPPLPPLKYRHLYCYYCEPGLIFKLPLRQLSLETCSVIC